MKVSLIVCGISYGGIRDFRHCFPNIKRNIIDPLKEISELSVYITTYNHELLKDMIDSYGAKECFIFENINDSNNLRTKLQSLKNIELIEEDFVVHIRPDTHFHKPITELNIDYNKFNFIAKEGHGEWELSGAIDDNFYCFPGKYKGALMQALIDARDYNQPHQNTHFIYPQLLQYIPEDQFHFIEEKSYDCVSYCNKVYTICKPNLTSVSFLNRENIHQEVIDRWGN